MIYLKKYRNPIERALEVSGKSKIIMQVYTYNKKKLGRADYRTIRKALSFYSFMVADLEKPEEGNAEESEMISTWKKELNEYNMDVSEIVGVKNALDQLLNGKNPPRMLLLQSIKTLKKMITLLRDLKYAA